MQHCSAPRVVARGDESDRFVDAISPNFIDQNGGFDPLLITEDVDEQVVLPAPRKPVRCHRQGP